MRALLISIIFPTSLNSKIKYELDLIYDKFISAQLLQLDQRQFPYVGKSHRVAKGTAIKIIG